jgi:hypothetical protein
MSFNGWKVVKTSRKRIEKFIEENHYSGSINGCISNYHYSLHNDKGIMVGAMFYGKMAMANQWKRFSDNKEDVIELRRLCCIDDTPINTESFFISRTLKMLKDDWKKGIVVSYADEEYGHTGTIYKASNFEYLGFSKGAKVIVYRDKLYHDKTIRTKYKGELKPFAKRLLKALETGEAYYKETKGKHTYIYELRNQKTQRNKINKFVK